MRRYEERCSALGELLRAKNEIVTTLLLQQQELTADNGTHKANFEAFNKQVSATSHLPPSPPRALHVITPAALTRRRSYDTLQLSDAWSLTAFQSWFSGFRVVSVSSIHH